MATMTAAAQAYEQAVAKGQKVYNRKQTSERCQDGTLVHSECPGTYFGFASYTIPTQFRCPCKCHTPKATCRRCGMDGLAWAESYKFGRTSWTLYQPLARPVNSTYRMQHTCGVDHNALAGREVTTQDAITTERDWLRAERTEARATGDDRRSAALTAYSPMIHDLARPGDLTFEEIVADELPEDEDIRARARALYDLFHG
jgi:hypothetical protein